MTSQRYRKTEPVVAPCTPSPLSVGHTVQPAEPYAALGMKRYRSALFCSAVSHTWTN